MIRALLARLRALFSGGNETVLDFLGLRAIDSEAGVLVLPDHIAALVDLGGTDYSYSDAAAQTQITDSWADLLNKAQMSVQLFIDARPLRWDIPGGYIDVIERQLPTNSTDTWTKRRFAKHRDAVLRGEIDSQIPGGSARSVRQYAVIRYAIGVASRREVAGEAAAYAPPPDAWRFWERPSYRYAGDKGMSLWRRERVRAITTLNKEVARFMGDAAAVPGFRPRRVAGLELVQLLHLLWREEAAYGEWIGDAAALEDLRGEASLLSDAAVEAPGLMLGELDDLAQEDK